MHITKLEEKHLRKAMTRKMVEAIGLNYPLSKGWKNKLLGMKITNEQQKDFMKAMLENEKFKVLPRKEKKNIRNKKRKQRKEFYLTSTWRALRYKAFKLYGRKCLCCGATPESGTILHVDHVKPRSKYPELELDIANLQILCEDCNLGKSNIDETDFRSPSI